MSSPVDTSAKFFNENLPDAPVLNGVEGSLIGLLTACLVTGFGLRAAVSLVVSGGVATLTLANEAKNANRLHTVVLVEGVTGALTALNGEQKITFASPTELKFATAAADGTATGAITVKTAPAGWEKVFPGTNTAGFKSLDPTSLGSSLWVNDAGTINANVRAYEVMTGVSAGTGAAPTVAESAAGGLWAKSTAASASAARWDLFADSRGFYYAPVPSSPANAINTGQPTYFFGDVTPYKSGDAFSVAIFSATTVVAGSIGNGSVLYGTQGGSSMSRFLRSYVGLGSAIAAFALPVSGSSNLYSGSDAQLGTFPSATDGGLRLSKIYCTEGNSSGATAVLRGEMPGIYYCPQTGLAGYFAPRDTITMGGKELQAVHSGANAVDPVGLGGRGFIDITGPWR